MQQYICIYIYWILYVHINIYIKAYICIYRQTNHTPHPKPLQQHDYSIPPPILSRHDILHLFFIIANCQAKTIAQATCEALPVPNDQSLAKPKST